MPYKVGDLVECIETGQNGKLGDIGIIADIVALNRKNTPLLENSILDSGSEKAIFVRWPGDAKGKSWWTAKHRVRYYNPCIDNNKERLKKAADDLTNIRDTIQLNRGRLIELEEYK